MTSKHSHLNAAQTTAIEHVLTSRDRVQGIQGVAGAGKTTAFDVIRAAAEGKGYEWKALLQPRAQRSSFVMLAFQRELCRAFLPADNSGGKSGSEDTCTSWMNQA